jgi:hypothetical protein
LMVPTIVYEVLLFPLLIVFVTKTWNDPHQGIDTPVNDIWALYFQNYRWMPLNQMWFAVPLFFFNIIAAISFTFIKRWREFAFNFSPLSGVLSTKQIMTKLLLLGLLLFVSNYAFRALFCSREYVWVPIIGNLAFICQYCVAFTFGIMANSYQLLDHLKKDHLRITLPLVVVLYMLFQV